MNVSNILTINKLENVSIQKIQKFHFNEDDNVSITSYETEHSSRSRKPSMVENRDPVKEFFIFVSFI